jgi:hypothetical protein
LARETFIICIPLWTYSEIRLQFNNLNHNKLSEAFK